jgi:cytochrome c-type biogenesis protein
MSNVVSSVLQEKTGAPRVRKVTVFGHSLLFVGGFSLIFVIGWGGAISVLGRLFAEYKSSLSQVGAVIVILFGLYNLGVINFRWLNNDTRPDWNHQHPITALSSFLMGVFFAAGWAPCIGTTLGAILTLGFSQNTVGQAMFLSFGYALGLGIPFLLMGLGVARISRLLFHLKPHVRKFQIMSGLFLVLIGVLILTNQMAWIAIWAQRNGLWIDITLGDPAAPSFFVALIAGLFSFLSPCVLPLVPAYIGYLGGYGVQASALQKG